MLRIGWPKPSAVSCVRALVAPKPQSHAGRPPHAPVVEQPHGEHGERDHNRARHQDDERPVGDLPQGHGGEQPPGSALPRNGGAGELPRHGRERGDDRHRREPEQDTARREPREPDALEQTAIPRARARALSRGRPRKMTPKNFTMTYPASAAQSATSAAPMGISRLTNECGIWSANRNDCSSSHSETKPLSGGSPARASAPMSESQATQGMRWMSPPRRPRLRSPVACSTAPVPRNSRLFIIAWLRQ